MKKFILSLGLNDRNSKRQEISTIEAFKVVSKMCADAVPAADAITVVAGYNEARTRRPSSEVFRSESPVFALFEKSEFRKLAGYGPLLVGGVVVVPVRDKKHGRIIAKNRNVWAFGYADGSQPLSEFLAKFSK